jgi:hypothetical protein
MVASRELRGVTPDAANAAAFLYGAEAALADVPNVTRIENKYDLAYKAAHDVGESMLAAYGYKTVFGPGAHEKIGKFLGAIFDTPPPSDAAAHYDVMRVDRNANHYRARPVTQAAATQAAHAAQVLYEAALTRLTG